ncbi:MAG TPA: HPP family protein [Prosthecobacter sp.]
MRRRRKERWMQAAAAALGGALAICLLGLTERSQLPLLMGSFGSSAVLVFGFPESGFCKPGRVIGAHVLCSAIGLAALHGLGPYWWAEGLSVGLCILAMLGMRLVHPPAGSNPLIVFALKADWSYLLTPALLGSVGLVTLVWLWQRLCPPARETTAPEARLPRHSPTVPAQAHPHQT